MGAEKYCFEKSTSLTLNWWARSENAGKRYLNWSLGFSNWALACNWFTCLEGTLNSNFNKNTSYLVIAKWQWESLWMCAFLSVGNSGHWRGSFTHRSKLFIALICFFLTFTLKNYRTLFGTSEITRQERRQNVAVFGRTCATFHLMILCRHL